MRLAGLALAVALAVPDRPAAGEPASTSGFTAEQVKTAVEEHIHRTMQESGGTYAIADAQAGETVELEFIHVGVVSAGNLWKVHDPGRRVEARSFFACTLFRKVGAPPENVYDVDMLIEPRDGGLAVTDVRIHKEKQLVRGEWVWETRPAAKQR